MYKIDICSNFSAKDFTPYHKNAVVIYNDVKLCSYTSDEAEKLCLHSSSDTCGDYCVDTKENLVEILYFRHFAKHFMFTSEGEKIRNKHLKNYFDVLVVVDIGCGNTNGK